MTFAANPVRRALLAWLAVAPTALLRSPPALAQLVEGRDYDRLRDPRPTDMGSKIEVVEFFSYGCPYCAALEPFLDTWLAKLPADVGFRRVPVFFEASWIPLARIYYTLDALGAERRLSPEVFKAIHGQGIQLRNDKAFFDWAASKGLDRRKVQDVYGSFAINAKLNRARQQAQRYDIQSVPTVAIDGKFITGSQRVGAQAKVPGAIDELIAKARAERGNKS